MNWMDLIVIWQFRLIMMDVIAIVLLSAGRALQLSGVYARGPS